MFMLDEVPEGLAKARGYEIGSVAEEDGGFGAGFGVRIRPLYFLIRKLVYVNTHLY